VAEQLCLAVLDAYDRMLGLELEHLVVDGCITKAPCGGQVAGPSPVDHRKQGLKRSVAAEASGIPLAALPAPANHRDDGLLAATLDALGVVGALPARPVVHLDAGYDYQPCRQVLAERGMAAQIAAVGCRHPSRSAAGWWWRSGWRWPVPSSSVADWSAAPGPTTAGRVARAAAHDRHLVQALTRTKPSSGEP
jgi:hypothetical protein